MSPEPSRCCQIQMSTAEGLRGYVYLAEDVCQSRRLAHSMQFSDLEVCQSCRLIYYKLRGNYRVGCNRPLLVNACPLSLASAVRHRRVLLGGSGAMCTWQGRVCHSLRPDYEWYQGGKVCQYCCVINVLCKYMINVIS